MFVKEGLARGYSTDFLKTNAVIQLGKVSKPYAGITDYQANKITIDSIFWQQNKNYEANRKFIMFHELGHFMLRREHDNSLITHRIIPSIFSVFVKNIILMSFLMRKQYSQNGRKKNIILFHFLIQTEN